MGSSKRIWRSDRILIRSATPQRDYKTIPCASRRVERFHLYSPKEDLKKKKRFLNLPIEMIYTCAGGRVTLAFVQILIWVLQGLVWPREILQRERDERDEERDEEGVKEVYTKCIRKKQTHDITASRAAFCPGESCTVPGTFIRCIMILTISSMEGRCEGSLDQQRVIRLSMGLGRFLMRGGRVPERTNK